MGLAFFLALLVPLLFSAGRRIRYSGALVAGAIIVIAPITVRNFIAYHRLIPISIQAGLSLAEGIGDFDPDGRLGMPHSDQEARVKDVEWAGRPDYGSSLWFPDGIERDQVRLSHAMTVVRDKPVWFLGVMFRRAAFMLRYSDSALYGWPQDSSVVAFVELEPPFSRQPIYEPRQGADPGVRTVLAYGGQILDEAATASSDSTPAWSASPPDLLGSGSLMSAGARATVEEDGQTLAITGDGSTYDNQFASELIKVEPDTDYILTTRVVPARATMAMKVLSADLKKALATVSLADAVTAAETTKLGPRSNVGEDGSGGRPADLREVDVQMAFASGSRTGLYVVVSNNGQALGAPSVRLRGGRLVAMGPTRGRATRIPRMVLRSLQKALFTTSHTVALIFLGVLLCLLAGQYRSAVIIAAVPTYYLAAQSVLHTEYRYVLGIHYFAFIAAAIALSCGLSFCTEAVRRLVPARRSDERALHQQQSMHPESVKD